MGVAEEPVHRNRISLRSRSGGGSECTRIRRGRRLALGLGWAVALALFYRRFGSIREVEAGLGLPVLAALVRVRRGGPDGRTAVIDHNAEAFRLLRTALEFAAVDRPLKAVAVTSCGPQEGKTTVAVGLAQAVAALGQRVLLVDADLRLSELHRVFKSGQSPGLTDWLVNAQLGRDGVIRAVRDGLHLLPAGTPAPNPGDLVASRRLRELVRQLAGEFDLVVVDSPPAAAGARLQPDSNSSG